MRFGALAVGAVSGVARRWLHTATQAQASVPARALYTGTGWGHALCAEKLMGSGSELWIVSAGFGLVAGDEKLPSYAATFASGENRVADKLASFRSSTRAHTAWWAGVNAARGRTETPLQNTFNCYDRVVVALSAPYLAALCADLELLARTLGPDKLWLVAVGAELPKLAPELNECVVPLTSKMERLIPSPRATLNLQVLTWWLSEVVPIAGWSRPEQSREIQKRLSVLQPRENRIKRSFSDSEVVLCIEEQRRAAGGVRPRGGRTRMLRTLREGGMACEQNRFSRLYEEVAARSGA